MEKFARLDSVTGKGMNSGFVIEHLDFYCESEINALTKVQTLGYKTLEEAYNDEVYYYTEWEDIDEDCYYDEFGNEYATN